MSPLRLAALTLAVSLLASCAAKASTGTDFKAFFDETFPLALQGFSSAQGAPVRYEASVFVANIHADPNQFGSCQINRFGGGFLSCQLLQYSSATWDDAVRNIQQSLPAAFKMFPVSLRAGSRHLTWVRHTDTLSVDLVEGFKAPPSIWVLQALEVPATPIVRDASIEPVPILNGAAALGTTADGLVIANDTKKSYILTALAYRPQKPLYVGAPFAPRAWRSEQADLVAQDPDTGLVLLSVPALPIRPQPLLANVTQGERVELLSVSECFYENTVDAFGCNMVPHPGAVVAVHNKDNAFEHSALPADGAPIADASSHRIVGISLSSFPKDGTIALQPAAIAAFLHRFAPAVAALAPQPEPGPSAVANSPVIARAMSSLVRIQALDPRSRFPNDGTGAIVTSDRNGIVIATAAHVLPSPKPAEGYRVTVYFRSGAAHTAQVRRIDERSDLALLEVPGAHVAAFRLASSAAFGTRIGVLGYGDVDFRFFRDDLAAEFVEGTVGQTLSNGLVNYDAVTLNGFSGGPVFDLRDGSLVGIVHGTTAPGTGGYEGVGVTDIRQLLAGARSEPPPSPALAVTHVTRSLVLIDCAKSGLTPAHLTGVIVASDTRRTYIATADLHDCQPVVHIAGNKRSSYPGREVPVDKLAVADRLAQPPDVDLVEIDAPNLTPLTLNADPLGATHAFILSFADSAIAQHSSDYVVPPRIDETEIGARSGGFFSNNGIDEGAAVFDASYARFLGIVPFVFDTPSLGTIGKYGDIQPVPPPAARASYSLTSASEIARRLEYSVDDVPYHRDHPLPRNFPDRTIFAVLQQGRNGGSPLDYTGFANAIALGSKDGRSYFLTALATTDRERLVLAVTNAHGATEKFDATPVAYDSSTGLALISTASVVLSAARWGTPATVGASVVVPYYSFCSWDFSRAATLRITPYALPACRYRASAGTLMDYFHTGTPAVSSLRGALGITFQGSPVVNPATLQFEGMLGPDTFANVISTDRIGKFLHANGWSM